VHDIKAYWGVQEQLHSILTSVLDHGEWSVSCPRYSTPRERFPGTHWIRGCVAPQPDDAL